MSKKKKLIPALRFPEFKEDGEWEEKKLGEVFEIGSGRDYKHLEPGNIPVYGSGGYMLSVDNYLYDGESVCIGRKGTIDKPMFLSGKFWTVDTLFYTHSFKGSWPKLIFYIFQKINWINHNEAGGIPSLSKTLINKIEVMLPSLPEQQKIADCLSSLDDLLAAHNEKLELLKGHKKGLMQNLFPQEGERVPKFRFPEFENDGEWEEKKLGEVFEIGSGRDYKHLKPGDIPVYGSGGYMLSVNDCLYDGESVCIGRKGTIDKPMFLSGKFWTVDTLFYTHSFKGSWPKLIFYIFQKINWINHNEAGGIPSLSKTLINKIEVMLPSLPEQQKIADCLSSLDDLLAAHNEKLELLKGHKKGLMQNLFPQEGERVPKFRFPEFENDGEWEEKKLGEIAEFSKGKGISKADIIDGGALPCIRYGELYTYYNETISEVKSFTNEGKENLVLSKANDVIIPASGETQIDIATASCVLREGIALGGDLNIIRTQINGVFLAYYLNNAKKYEIAQMAQGVSVIHLYPTQLQTLTTCFPGKSEQQKIASCLSAVDDLIKAETEKIEALKAHKKGLMQGLFPKMEN